MKGTDPIIVLTYPHAGAELLTGLLSASPHVTCTSATGLLPLCHEAASTWQRLEGRIGVPSPLAITSVRALATTMITVINAGTEARRWCETTFASAEVAETFLRVFPATTFLCLHRSLPGVFGEAARAYPWGLGESPFWRFSAGHPGNNAATIAAYWAAFTASLLDFEARHPGACIRMRYEDMAADPGRQASGLLTALGLGCGEHATLHPPRPDAPAAYSADASGPPVPVSRIPPPLLTSVRELQARLAYDPWPE